MLRLRAVFASAVVGAATIAGFAPGVSMPPHSADLAQAELSIIVPIVAPASSTPLIAATDLASYTAADGVLSRELDAVTGRVVTLAIDPMIIASIRVLGSAAPASAVVWLARLAALKNPSFALGYADADLSAQTQAGSPAPLAPESFGFAIDPTRFAQPGVTPAPGDSTGSTLPVLPTSDAIADWQYTLPAVAWPREDTVVAGDLTAFAAAGFVTTIVGSGNLRESPESHEAVSVAGKPVMISDDAVSLALRAAVDAASNDDWQGAMSRLAAVLGSTGASHASGEPILATLERVAPAGATRLGQTLDALAPMTALTPVAVPVANATRAEAQLEDRPQDAARLREVASILNAEALDRGFATVVPDPVAITAKRRLALLATLSNAWQADPASWVAAVQKYLTASTDLRASVSVVASSTFNLLADRATLPIAVRNSLDQPITVYISVDPATALIAVTNSRVPITVAANSQSNGQIPVQAISNGQVRVDITLESAAGSPIGSGTSSTINVQAGWETPVVVAVAVVVFVLFAAGIVRNVIRRRRFSLAVTREESQP